MRDEKAQLKSWLSQPKVRKKENQERNRKVDETHGRRGGNYSDTVAHSSTRGCIIFL